MKKEVPKSHRPCLNAVAEPTMNNESRQPGLPRVWPVDSFRRGDRAAEGAALEMPCGGQTSPRVRIPPSPLALHVVVTQLEDDQGFVSQSSPPKAAGVRPAGVSGHLQENGRPLEGIHRVKDVI